MFIYIHGNCQSTALKMLLAPVLPDCYVHSREVHLALQAEAEDYKNDVRNADIIISQPVSEFYGGGEYLSSKWIEQNRKPGSKLITFPSMYFRGFHPWMFTLKGLAAANMPYHDLHVVEAFLEGLSPEAATEQISRADFLPAHFVRAEYDRTLSELRRRELEAGVTAPVSDLIGIQDSVCFLVVNHPTRKLLNSLADRILDQMGRPERSIRENSELIDLIIFPPYPSSILGLNVVNFDCDTFKAAYHYFDRLDYIQRAFESYRDIGREKILGAMEQAADAVPYLQRHKAYRRDAGIDKIEVVRAAFRAILRRDGSLSELVQHAKNIDVHGLDKILADIAFSQEAEQARPSRLLSDGAETVTRSAQ